MFEIIVDYRCLYSRLYVAAVEIIVDYRCLYSRLYVAAVDYIDCCSFMICGDAEFAGVVILDDFLMIDDFAGVYLIILW
jgi:hypothetical protein